VKLTLDLLDPSLVERFHKRVAELQSQQASFHGKKNALQTRVRQRAAAQTGLNYLALSSSLLITGVSWVVCANVPELSPWPFAALLAEIPFYFWFTRRLTHNAQPKFWRAFVEGESFTRVERAYLDALVGIEQAEESLALPLLKSLNELVASGRAIEKKQGELARYHQGTTLENLQQELTVLEQRVRDAQSPEAAETFRQSVTICQRRLENRRALALVEERLEAQSEALCQTIASLTGTLARAHAAPLGQETPALKTIVQTISEVTRQAQATEAAVQEVLTAGLN
jgi:hypothetical protein